LNAEFFPQKIDPKTVLHQEGLFGLLAIVAIFIRQREVVGAFLPNGSLVTALGVGMAAAVFFSLLDRLLARLPAARRLEEFQAEMISTWTGQDIVSVAFLSGIAEEALIRAFLQPWIGLIPAAFCFGILHIVPDRKLWFWPFAAFGVGIVLGFLYLRWGYPACATAHILINALSFFRLRRAGIVEDPGLKDHEIDG